jgi:hypothetical protein
MYKLITIRLIECMYEWMYLYESKDDIFIITILGYEYLVSIVILTKFKLLYNLEYVISEHD